MNNKTPRTSFRWAIWVFISACSIFLLLGGLLKFLPFSIIEVFGFVTGAICVMLTVEESIWNWPLGLANNFVFIVLFLNQQLYADMGLQAVYVVLSVFGWYQWLHGGKKHGRLLVRRSQNIELGILAAIGILATIGMTIFLTSIHDSAPFLDALTTVLSLMAQYLLTRKAIENWFVWMTADIIYVGMYLSKGLVLTAVLYGLFFLLCIGGLRVWLKKYRENLQPPVDAKAATI